MSYLTLNLWVELRKWKWQMQMIIAAGCAASCLWYFVSCSWNFRDETEMKLEFSRKLLLTSNVRSLPLPIIFCYFVVSSWASPFIIIRNIDISFQLCVFEFIKLKIHPIIQIDIEPRCELEWSRGEVNTAAAERRGTPAPAPWPPSPRSSGSPSLPSSSSTSATPCVSPCRSATTIKPLNQQF